MEIRVFTIRSVESDTAREDGRGDGIEEAVVKNARVPLLAAPSATVSNAGLLNQTPSEKMDVEIRLQ